MPNGSGRNFNLTKVKKTLGAFFDNMNVGDMVSNEEILDYLSNVPIIELKDIDSDKKKYLNRRLSRSQLYTSLPFFMEVVNSLPHVLRGPLYSRDSNYIRAIMLAVKTNENRDVICFNCDKYLVNGAKEYHKSITRYNRTRRENLKPLARHIMCAECYKYEVKMFSPFNKAFADGMAKGYDKWDNKRNWSEEE